jgi:hypothetical protein
LVWVWINRYILSKLTLATFLTRVLSIFGIFLAVLLIDRAVFRLDVAIAIGEYKVI